MADRSPDSGPLSPAEVLFAQWLRRGTNATSDFEVLCRAHAEHSVELRRLRERLAEVSPGPQSFGHQLHEHYGSGVDPSISLKGDEKSESTSGSSELLQRLAEHSVKTPRYRIHGELARGGMGAILKVFDEDLRRALAMKVILGRGEASASGDTPPVDRRVLARFLEEAQVTGQLDHPGIVPVHELGLDERGRVYFTMKLVKGRDLKMIFDLVFDGLEDWNETRALTVLLKVCEAVAYAHEKGVIHRDLKPANVMVGSFGEVYVMDWGLARVIGREDMHDLRLKPEGASASLQTERREERSETPDSPLITMDGDVVGTPSYMSPEQARGEVERLGPRSDVYAIGAMLYHMLARQMPYASGARISNRTVLARLIDGPPTALRKLREDVPAELEAICEKAMAREPDTRYADTLALAEDLRAYLEGRVVRAHRTGAIVELEKWVQRNKALAGSIAAGLLALIAGLSVSLVLKAQSDRNAELAVEREELAEYRRIEAEASKALAERSAALASEREKGARWQTYVSSLLAAGAANHLNEPGNLRRALDAAPEEHRGWEWHHLDAAADSSLLVVRHGMWQGVEGRADAGVRSASFSPDGSRFVTASDTVGVWDASTGAELLVLRSNVWAASFSPDGSRIVTASINGARVWDAVTGAELLLLRSKGPQSRSWRSGVSRVQAASFSPDGSRIVTALEAESASVWNAEAGTEVLQLYGHQGDVWLASFSPDGSRILTASNDKTVRVWDAETGGERAILRGHEGVLQAAAFSPDGSRIVTSSVDKTARLWNTETGAELFVFGHEQTVEGATFSPDGARIVTASHDNTACVWDSQTGKELLVLRGHQKAVQVAVFSTDGSQIVTGSHDGTIRIWATEDGRELAVLRGHEDTVNTASFHSGGSRIVTASSDGTARVWAVDTGPVPLVLSGHEGSVESSAFSPDGSRIVTASRDKTSVWDTETGAELLVLPGHKGLFPSATFSHDGSRIITSGVRRSARGRISISSTAPALNDIARIWDANTGTELLSFPGFKCASLDSSRILTASPDGAARVWDATTGLELLVLPNHDYHDSIVAASFNPDGSRIVTGSDDGTNCVFDASTGLELLVLPNDHSDEVSFSPDGSRIITGQGVWDAKTGEQLFVLDSSYATFSPDGSRIVATDRWWARTGRVLDAETGAELLVLRGHDEAVNSATFSPTGSRVITASSDKTARIWDARTGDELLVLRGHDGSVEAATFSSDGSRIVTASSDGTARVWDSIPFRVRHATLHERAASAHRAVNQSTASSPDARRILDALEPACANLIEVVAKIRSDASMDPVVRREALDLVTRSAHEASEWVYALRDELHIPKDLLAKIEEDVSRRPEVKKHALFLARSLKVDSSTLKVVSTINEGALRGNNQAWEIVRLPDRSSDDYAKALRLIELADAHQPGRAFLVNTLGVAQYRSGLYEEALATLTRSIELAKKSPDDPPHPSDLAFVAMTQFQLGEIEAAKASLQQLRDLMQDEDNAQDEDDHAFLSEARALIEPPEQD